MEKVEITSTRAVYRYRAEVGNLVARASLARPAIDNLQPGLQAGKSDRPDTATPEALSNVDRRTDVVPLLVVVLLLLPFKPV